MKDMDRDGLLLCDLQAKMFELSVDMAETSSAIFVRRFMNSKAAKWMDSGTILSSNTQPADLLEMIEEEYGATRYGSVKYTHNEMYWMGYVYRFYAYTYEESSVKIYRMLKPKELRGVFLPYHTLDPAQAIERIREAQGLDKNRQDDIMRQFEIFRRIRSGSVQ